MMKNKIRKVSVTRLVKWYKESLGSVSDKSFFFPVFRRGRPVGGQAVLYNTARVQLNKEREVLGLGKITWHSWRIGAAAEAARKRVSREVIMKSGGWISGAVDIYIRFQDRGVMVGDALL